MKKRLLSALILALAIPAYAQQAPAETPPPPSWKQGMSEKDAASPLHPFAPVLAGVDAKDLPINTLKAPPGFKVEVWMDGVPNARSLLISPKGTVFVSNRIGRNVYAIVDKNGKRELITIAKGLDTPNGIAMIDGALYVAERNKILKYENIEANLNNPPTPTVIVDGIDPTNGPGHFWKYLVAGPDKKLYFNIGSPGNIVLPNYAQAAIMRVDPKTGQMEKIASGVRNSVGMDFHPVTKKLWFTEHARDWLGEDFPHDELNVLSKVGEDFGYPFCHQGDIADPIFGKFASCNQFTPPVLKMGAHVAPLGMRFYTGKMFPAEYKHNIFVARHGSWNKTTKQGYDVMRVVLDNNGKVAKYEPFLTGFMTNDQADPPMWGRPVDVQIINDGSMLVSDDHNGIIYRVSYNKPMVLGSK